MDFSLDDGQRLLLESAERFVRERLGLGAAESHGAAGLWAQMAEMGWLALPLPESAGGLGGAMEDVVLLMTALGAGVTSLPYVSGVILCGHVLAHGRENGASAALLEGLASGAARLSFVRGAAGTPIRATGAGHALTGAGALCYDAPGADAFVVSAVLDDGRPALLLAQRTAPGITMEPYPLIHGGDAADVAFAGTGAILLAEGEAAAALLSAAATRAVLANLAQLVGCLEAALRITADYVKGREQFGRPIGQFQAIKHMLADRFVDAQEARSILYYALSAIEGDHAAQAVAAARLVIGEAARRICEDGIQLHGGYGLTDEYEIGHLYRKALLLDLMLGDLT